MWFLQVVSYWTNPAPQKRKKVVPLRCLMDSFLIVLPAEITAASTSWYDHRQKETHTHTTQALALVLTCGASDVINDLRPTQSQHQQQQFCNVYIFPAEVSICSFCTWRRCDKHRSARPQDDAVVQRLSSLVLIIFFSFFSFAHWISHMSNTCKVKQDLHFELWVDIEDWAWSVSTPPTIWRTQR